MGLQEYQPCRVQSHQRCRSRNPRRAKNLEKIGLEELRTAGLVGKKDLVKVLANGSLTRKLAVEANAFSAAAEKAIVEAGGSINKVK